MTVKLKDQPLDKLRLEVRAYLQSEIANGGFTPALDAWNVWDQAFSRRLADAGWVGTAIPMKYGGAGRDYLERFVVMEELLAAGAPVGAHWVAERQAAPALLAFGTEEQRQEFLPRITRAELGVAIGMSEPDSGSDLASIRTTATYKDQAWNLNGSKVWTSGAHHADVSIVLARTAARSDQDRHAGLSQFIVDLRAPGVTVRPIRSMGGAHHFNEVFLDDVIVPEHRLLGKVGQGWKQVTAELGFERSGPERFLSAFPLFRAAVRLRHRAGDNDAELGRYAARLRALHTLSSKVATELTSGGSPNTVAAMVKTLGTLTEGDMIEYVSDILADTDLVEIRALLETSLLLRPGFTIRGGTSEILRGVISRQLGLR